MPSKKTESTLLPLPNGVEMSFTHARSSVSLWAMLDLLMIRFDVSFICFVRSPFPHQK